MSSEILTEDLMSVFLVLAEENTDISLGELLERLDKWQRLENRHFGIGWDDMRTAFWVLWFEKNSAPRNRGNFEEIIKVTSLKAWIQDILEYQSVYCNDECSHWVEAIHSSGAYKPGQVMSFRNQLMRRFFSVPENHTPHQISLLLKRLGVGLDILRRCSREGRSS